MIYQSGITQTKDLFTAIFLLDVSGSMAGPKIQKLNQCMEDIVNELKILSKESSIQVSVITFGNRVDIHTPLTNVLDLNWQPLIASGGTPMGAAISKAKLLIVDSNLMKITIFKPIIILISDGQPTDDWKNPLQDFIAQDKLTLCDRHALAIGEAASQAAALQMFAHPNQVFEAQDAKNIPQFFKHVQNTITQSISVSLSQQGAQKSSSQQSSHHSFTPSVSTLSTSSIPPSVISYKHLTPQGIDLYKGLITIPSKSPPEINTGSHTPSKINTGSHTPSKINTGSHIPSEINTGSHTPSEINTGSHTPSEINTGSHTPSEISSQSNPKQSDSYKPVSFESFNLEQFYKKKNEDSNL